MPKPDMTPEETAAYNAKEQARYQFVVLGIYPTGHGIEARVVHPAEVHATLAEIRRSGAEPVITEVVKDGYPIAAHVLGKVPRFTADTIPSTPEPAREFGIRTEDAGSPITDESQVRP